MKHILYWPKFFFTKLREVGLCAGWISGRGWGREMRVLFFSLFACVVSCLTRITARYDSIAAVTISDD